MKQLVCFFIFNLCAHASYAECITPTRSTPFLELEKVSEILSTSEIPSSQKHRRLELVNYEEAKKFLEKIEEKKRIQIEDVVKSIKDSIENVIPLYEDFNEHPILLLSGLDFNDFPYEWIKPFHSMLSGKKSSYFFKWNKFDSIKINSSKLADAIKKIKSKHPNKELTIIGYSAGGIVLFDALDSLNGNETLKDVKPHTVAAPIFGYNAPALAILGAPFVGMTSIQIGMGYYEKLKNKKFENCTQWITTSCELDKHACSNSGNNPQTGRTNETLCKNSKPELIDNEGHASVLNRAINEILKN